MPEYPTFWFMIRKKWFSNSKQSDSQILLKTQKLNLQIVDSNNTYLSDFFQKAVSEVGSNAELSICNFFKKEV